MPLQDSHLNFDHSGPPSTGLGLLSLSIAAANAVPILAPKPDPHPASGSGKHHRRLSSTSRARRRLSDARDAAVRPSPAVPHTTAAALSLASLSLSSSPPQHPTLQPLDPLASPAIPIPFAGDGTSRSVPNLITALPIQTNGSGGKSGKRRGATFTCESCSKVYRHPSCLIKHRWEHSPHWREASKFVLSKHQQVQLLEAAAILSHLSPAASGGSSLPEDRSLWPSFLSGGLLPPPSSSPSSASPLHDAAAHAGGDVATRTSSSVPTSLTLRSIRGQTAGDGSVLEEHTPLLGVSTPTPSSVPGRTTHGEAAPYDVSSSSSSRWPPSPSCVRSASDSVSESEDFECDYEDVDPFDYLHRGSGFGARGRMWEKLKEGCESGEEAQEWDGMEMEMEMD